MSSTIMTPTRLNTMNLTRMTYRLPKRQRGMVLVIGLIFLMLLTVISVTAVQTTTLDERMSQHLRDRNLAFQGAEAALRDAETWLEDSDSQTNVKANTPITNIAAWDGASNPTPTSSVDMTDWPAQPLADPVYYVEQPTEVFSEEDLAWGTSGAGARKTYTITAFAIGQTISAEVVLQSYYRPYNQ